MNNEERILEILIAMQGDIQQIHHRLDSLETRISSMETRVSSMEARVSSIENKLDDLIEAHEETRTSVNILIDWAVRASNTLNFPLPKIV